MKEIKIRNLLEKNDPICFVVSNLFSKDDCKSIINKYNAFQSANEKYPTYYRNNERQEIIDDTFAEILLTKCIQYIPNEIKLQDESWELQEINPKIRLCRYLKNQYFHRHLDGVHYKSEQEQSFLTFMIYLNDSSDFIGGKTLFYKTKYAKKVWVNYQPKIGDIIIFDHSIWHEGERLLKGEKYVLRSDIIYKKNKSENKNINHHLGYIWKLIQHDNTIISCGRDKRIKIWNEELKTLSSIEAHQNSILALCLLSKNTFISASRDKKIKVWNTAKNKISIVKEIDTHRATITDLAKIDKNTFASCGADNSIMIHNISNDKTIKIIAHTDWIWKLLKIGQTLVSCGEDGVINIIDLKTHSIFSSFSENAISINSLCYLKHIKTLLAGNIKGEVLLFQFKNNELIYKNKIKIHKDKINDIQFLPNNLIATASEDNYVKVFNLQRLQIIKQFEHPNFVTSITFSKKSNSIFSACYDGKIRKFDLSLII